MNCWRVATRSGYSARNGNSLDISSQLSTSWDICLSSACRRTRTGAELVFEVFSQRHERGSTLVTSNLPFDEWTRVYGLERLTGALLDRPTHHGRILEMNGDSYRLNQSKRSRRASAATPADNPTQA
jgi:IstB-like ATP binding protein